MIKVGIFTMGLDSSDRGAYTKIASLRMTAIPSENHLIYLDVHRYRVERVEWYLHKNAVEDVQLTVVRV